MTTAAGPDDQAGSRPDEIVEADPAGREPEVGDPPAQDVRGETGAGRRPSADSSTDADADADADADGGADADLDSGADPGADPDLEPGAGAGAESQAGSGHRPRHLARPSSSAPSRGGASHGHAPDGADAAQLHRQRHLVLAGIAALTLMGTVLAVVGLSTVRTSTAGRYEQAAGADDPGYQAHVVPTPTLGVLHRGADGSLSGASVLAIAPGDDSGSAILMPPATLVPGADGDTTLAEIYRTEGAPAAARSLGIALTAAVTEHVEVDDAQWARLVEPVGGLEVTTARDLGRWPAGDVALDPTEVGPFLSTLADGETDLDRLERQQRVWNAWLPLVASGDDDVLPGEVGTGIGRFVRAVAQGGGTAEMLPVARVDQGDQVVFRPESGRIGQLVSRAVPFPLAPTPGARIRVRLLNGTRDGSITTLAAQALVAGGAQISIAGNAATFDVAETSLVYAGEDGAGLAEWLSNELGGGRVEEVTSGQDGQVPSDDEIDVTVILGDDAVDLIER